ncbi:heavy metal translocating P-type ATPase [Mariniblastus fucicola]|uniref:Putative copper-importing P-type ATPase A n=1 Tax=Mariniblastus fucicola TaxID=980251 RepID=A0A5B9PBC9_9BACT|nr:heavy metal translocating P-type ATPase [Mariniblastus fucicola]QEG20423.1 putative copper-importing P-type ATPase A [Mariniblastus fucicola]
MIQRTNHATKVQCTHCSLPVPAGLVKEDCEEQFCCGGCESAWNLIHGHGLDAFYRMASPDSRALSLKSTSSLQRLFNGFDEADFQDKYVAEIQSDQSKIELAVEGMHCAACIWLIEKLPTILPGVVEANVHWGRRTVSVIWHRDSVALSQIAVALDNLGYRPTPVRQNSTRQRWQRENRKHLTRIGVAAACAGNNMVISAALYLGMFSHMTVGMSQLLRVASGIVGIAALAWPGRTFLNSALASIRTRTPHMDLPIALALLVGTTAGLVNVVRGAGEIYFDSLAVLIFLLLVGRWVQFRQQSKANDSVDLLQQLTPQTTRRLIDGEPVEVLVDLVKVDDQLQIKCGDLFPTDGRVVDSSTDVDESILTGESVAVRKMVGDPVFAGTTNVGSTVVVNVENIGQETRLGQIVDLVEQASSNRPKIVQWANQVGGYFVVAVMLLAALTLVWWIPQQLDVAVDRSIALLIVACPCALALATPLAIAVALGRAARRRIMIKSGDVLQSLQRPGMIWLDKTGTVTDGALHVARWHGGTDSLMEIAAIEMVCSHPVAKAIADFCLDANPYCLFQSDWRHLIQSLRTRDIVNHPGLGVSGSVDDLDVVIGSRKLLSSLLIPFSEPQRRIELRIIARGGSPCWVAINGVVVAIAELMDRVRPEATSAIDALKNRGWQVGLLSGDHQDVANRVAGRLGISPEFAIGGATPEQKLSIVESSDYDTVVMVGDGVNDSAALAAATVGVAVKNSAEASLMAAPVYLADPGLNPILGLMSLSDSTTGTMRLNLAVSVTYNVVFASLAFLGYINPLVAAILMPISSITVVALSLTAGRFSPISKPLQDGR